ncbi:hypothetical protein [Flavobacterium sp.]|uniref:hypothetical protein n=1 Tax=Flavobacterium sp. TaxID=239 RepID=UPI0025CDFCC1|nr:hypothetical protein [Flavobacterium sp.]
MNRISSKTFTAVATLGLLKGYTSQPISLSNFKKELQIGQKAVLDTTGVALITKVTPCEIVFLGQEEPSVTLEWIQYPKFSTDEVLLKKAIIHLVELLMAALEQNRTVIVFADETICLEKSGAIDPRIKLNAESAITSLTTSNKTPNTFLYPDHTLEMMKTGVVYDSKEFLRDVSEDSLAFKIRSKNQKS